MPGSLAEIKQSHLNNLSGGEGRTALIVSYAPLYTEGRSEIAGPDRLGQSITLASAHGAAALVRLGMTNAFRPELQKMGVLLVANHNSPQSPGKLRQEADVRDAHLVGTNAFVSRLRVGEREEDNVPGIHYRLRLQSRDSGYHIPVFTQVLEQPGDVRLLFETVRDASLRRPDAIIAPFMPQTDRLMEASLVPVYVMHNSAVEPNVSQQARIAKANGAAGFVVDSATVDPENNPGLLRGLQFVLNGELTTQVPSDQPQQ